MSVSTPPGRARSSATTRRSPHWPPSAGRSPDIGWARPCPRLPPPPGDVGRAGAHRAGGRGGRLTLGIGLSHQLVIENSSASPSTHPARHIREYLSILMPLLEGEPVNFTGGCYVRRLSVRSRSIPPPVLVAALGRHARARRPDGRRHRAWMTGPATRRIPHRPDDQGGGRRAGGPSPRVAVGLPVCVTGDPTPPGKKAAETFAVCGTCPRTGPCSIGKGPRGRPTWRSSAPHPSAAQAAAGWPRDGHRFLRGAVRVRPGGRRLTEALAGRSNAQVNS